jgi:hypothetical protein
LRARYDPPSSSLWVAVLEVVTPATVQGEDGKLTTRDIGPGKVRTTWVPFRDLHTVAMLRWGGLGLDDDDYPGGNRLEDQTASTFGGPSIFGSGYMLDERKILKSGYASLTCSSLSCSELGYTG